MNRIVYINASPRVDEVTSSGTFLSMLDKYFDDNDTEKAIINVRKSVLEHQSESDFDTILKADAVVIAFPLYFFCLPGLLTRFLQDYHSYYFENEIHAHRQKIYTIVNCGFPEANINEEAVKVIESFSRQIGAEFRLGIMIGSGGMVIVAKDAPFMKKPLKALEQAMNSLAQDAMSERLDPISNIQITVKVPRWLYYLMADMGFNHTATKNGNSKKDILKKAYQPD